jgi:hypothetical protein
MRLISKKSNNLGFRQTQNEDEKKQTWIAVFELDGKKVMCNTWSRNIPSDQNGLWIDDEIKAAEPFTRKDAEGNDVTITPRANTAFAQFEKWEMASKMDMLEAMKESSITIKL